VSTAKQPTIGKFEKRHPSIGCYTSKPFNCLELSVIPVTALVMGIRKTTSGLGLLSCAMLSG
jgi:hypothetical protein